ncbi:MAG TPA: penicillin-binding transpeptidase domain-containing protein, partial [Tepidiformaceae bacterium]|nr:penicillin-binding transpeptidase domain-containing protein [Tepidiformaceae bacterium]
GFGQPTGIDLYGEAAGLIPDPAWKRRHYVGEPWGPGDDEWFLGDTYNSAIGQGNVLATPLQITRMTAAIVNGGRLVTPHVVNRVIGPDGEVVRTIQPRYQDVGVSQKTLEIIKEGMLGSVQYGAGARAALSQRGRKDGYGRILQAQWAAFAARVVHRLRAVQQPGNRGHGVLRRRRWRR